MTRPPEIQLGCLGSAVSSPSHVCWIWGKALALSGENNYWRFLILGQIFASVQVTEDPQMPEILCPDSRDPHTIDVYDS